MDSKACYPNDFKTRRLPIEHVVILWQENRTYDHMFSDTHGNSDKSLPIDSDPPRVAYQTTPTHGNWWSMRYGHLNEYHSRLTRKQLPLFYEWAERNAALCDNYYVEKDGPSDFNHDSTAAADFKVVGRNGKLQSHIDNPPKNQVLRAAGRVIRNDPDVATPLDVPVIQTSLENKHFTWASYGESAFNLIKTRLPSGYPLNESPCLKTAEDFAAEARGGQLPTVSWVMPPFDKTGHAPESQGDGMVYVGEQLQAIVDGGLWEKTAVFVVWDDSGGFADHMPAPSLERLAQDPHRQDRSGKRVPCLVISPFAKADYRSGDCGGIKTHRSILKFVNEWLALPALDAAREAQVGSMWDCFDFEQKPSSPPRTTLRPGELNLERSFLQRVGLECQRIPGKFEANIMSQAIFTLWLMDRTLGPDHPMRKAVSKTLKLDPDNFKVGRFSRQGIPGSKLGYALYTPIALMAWPIGIVVDAVIAALLAHGHTMPFDPHGNARNNDYKVQLQRTAKAGIMAPSTLVHPDAWSQITRELDDD